MNCHRRFSTTLFASVLLGTVALGAACEDDVTEIESRKGEIDQDELTTGVNVVLGGGRGSFILPFVEPVPEVEDDVLAEELSTAVTFVIRSDVTDSTADIASGTLVTDAAPTAPGQWTFELNEARDAATITFVNEDTAGLTLKTDRTYTGTLAVVPNTYIESVASFTMSVSVSGG